MTKRWILTRIDAWCFSLLAALMLLFNAGCGAVASVFATRTPTPTQTYTSTTTFTPTLTFTPTSTPTLTFTPTATLTPTQTPTPTLTPTPVGFYYSPVFMFSLYHPQGWTVDESDKSEIKFLDANDGLALLAMSEESDSTEEFSLALITGIFRQPNLGLFVSSTLGKKDSVTLGDGTKAVRQEINGKTSDGMDLTMWIACAKSDNLVNPRLYTFIFFGLKTKMYANTSVMDEIYKSIKLGEIAE
jgi:hypothetical protein